MNWDDYFVMFLDYMIHIDDILTKGNTVVALGSFSQTYPVKGELREENHYSVPAVWRAKVKKGFVSLWQINRAEVFCRNGLGGGNQDLNPGRDLRLIFYLMSFFFIGPLSFRVL